MINIILFFTRFHFFRIFFEKLIFSYQELRKIEKQHELTATEIAQRSITLMNSGKEIKTYKQPQGNL